MTARPNMTGRRGLPAGLQAKLWASRFAAGLPCRARCAVSSLRAGIPLACARCRSLRAPLAKDKDGGASNKSSYRRVVQSSHTCSLQQPCGSSGRCAPYGLTQEALRRAVKVADREDGLRVITDRLVLQRDGPWRGAAASRCTASNPFAEPFVAAPRRRAGPSGPARPGAVMTTGMDLLRSTVPTGTAAPSSAPARRTSAPPRLTVPKARCCRCARVNQKGHHDGAQGPGG